MNERFIAVVEPVPRNLADAARTRTLLQIVEDLKEESTCRHQVVGSDGDMIEQHSVSFPAAIIGLPLLPTNLMLAAKPDN
jgi:hypothetical protein